MEAGHLWLIGMMGAGKTAVGRRLASHLGRSFIDVDDEIVAEIGTSIAEFWGTNGEPAFRDVERSAIAAAGAAEPAVIATGGGAVLCDANVATMRATGKVVWLDAAVGTLAVRIGRGRDRPLLMDADTETRLREILSARRSRYDAAADARVATDGLAIDDVAERIEVWWNAS